MSPADVVRVQVTLGDDLFLCLSFADGEEPPEWRAPHWAPKESS